MAIPTPTFGPKGFLTPAEPDILVARKDEINTAFGGALNMADETPQGQLAVSETAAIGNANDSFVYLSNMFDPAYSQGRYQDAIARIYFIERLPSQPTVVTVSCLGLEGVVIPVGSMVQTSDGNLYTSTQDAVIPASGTIDVPFACNIPGPIPCPAGSVTTIYRAVNGWDSVTNSADGAIGRNTETRAEFEQRRALSVALNSNGAVPSILGAVLDVAGVLDAYVTENVNNTPLEIKGFTLAPNSIYVAAVGGLAADVAKAIWTRKSPGCGYNGNTTVTVLDQNPAYNPPYPAYDVSFEIPADTTVIFQVTIANLYSVPANATDLIQAAIVAAFAGEDGGPRARIGDTIFASRFYAPVALLGPWAQIVTIKLGCANLPIAEFVAHIDGTVMTIDSLTGGIIASGQTVVGAGVLPGTVITGGTGTTWTVNLTQTVASGAMKSIVAIYDEVSIQIDEEPVVALGDITVRLL